MSDFLFSRPNFLSGFARALDLFGLFDSYNISSTPEEADSCAIFADWKAVGGDLQDSIMIEAKKSDVQEQSYNHT